MYVSFEGIWEYHPLLIWLANTGEPLFIINRSGNRPSHDRAPTALDEAIARCKGAGYGDVLLRGDTDFKMTAHLDRWDAAGVRFVFGYGANRWFVDRAENIHIGDYEELVRMAHARFAGRPRAFFRGPVILWGCLVRPSCSSGGPKLHRRFHREGADRRKVASWSEHHGSQEEDQRRSDEESDEEGEVDPAAQ